jgi:hypothetical protein
VDWAKKGWWKITPGATVKVESGWSFRDAAPMERVRLVLDNGKHQFEEPGLRVCGNSARTIPAVDAE